ncbi:MAG: CBS domain-containing protein, partial [Planctomycetota bacterium]
MTVARHLRLIDTTAHPNDTATALRARRHKNGSNCAPVLDRRGRLLGLVTARDLVPDAVATGCDPDTTTVRSMMQRHVETILLDATATQALARMRERRTQYLLVVDERRRLYGIVWLYDLAEDVPGPFGELEDRLQNEGDVAFGQRAHGGDAALLHHPPAAVLFAMQAMQNARGQRLSGGQKASGAQETVRRCRRHICRRRWCRGG